MLHLVGAHALAYAFGLRLGQPVFVATQLLQQRLGVGDCSRGQGLGQRGGYFPADAGAC